MTQLSIPIEYDLTKEVKSLEDALFELFNVLDINGKTPKGLSANWRIARDVFNDAGRLIL